KAAALRSCELSAEAIKSGRAGRLVHFSTFHVYGKPARDRYDEDSEVAPEHAYGRNHRAGELRLRDLLPAERLSILRLVNILAVSAHASLGGQANLLLLDLCRQAATSGSIQLQNDGLSYRAFAAFSDLVEAVRILVQKPLSKPSAAGPMNISAGTAQRID